MVLIQITAALSPMLDRIFMRKPRQGGSTTVLPDGFLTPDEKGQRTSAAKAVNDLLNYYIGVADSKASIFLAGSVTAAGLLLFRYPPGLGSQFLYLGASLLLGISLVCTALVIIPRLPPVDQQVKGGIYWGDIIAHPDVISYGKTFAERASTARLDEDYIILNYKTALILRHKMSMLRIAILCFVTGVTLAILHHATNHAG